MHSEFYSIALDRIRYSLVWEDHKTLYEALQIQPEDRLLVITSAGCNVLNALLKSPQEVVAIDLNPVQNSLLRLKQWVILQHPHCIFRGLMGFDGPQAVKASWAVVAQSLPREEQQYWAGFFAAHPEGIVAAGRLEGYLNGFYGTLPAQLQEALKKLISFDKLQEQWAFFLKELHETSFKSSFIQYFDEQSLSKGRDPKLFRYTKESGGESFYNRLLQQLASVLVKDNFFFRFFFFGPVGLPEDLLPPCYQLKHYLPLRAQLHKLRIVLGEATDYLLSAEGSNLTKASLSNIFEYTSEAEFEKVCQQLFHTPAARKLRVVYWNLLMDQRPSPFAKDNKLTALSEKLSRQEACFYFRNVRVMEAVPVPVQA